MKQITEDYCSFEVAKLLKEKGFDWQQSPFYSEQDKDEWKQENSYQIPNPDYDPDIPFDTETITMVAPHISQSLALKWLREVYNIYIDILTYTTGKSIQFRWVGYDNGRLFSQEEGKIIYFESYEKAVEAACLYVLKNLI